MLVISVEMRWIRYAACFGEINNVYTILLEILRGAHNFSKGYDRRIMLKWF
jgi:hypothetical protein